MSQLRIFIKISGLLLTLCLVLVSTQSFSQNKEFTRSFFPDNRDALREAQRNLRDGDRLFEGGPGNYEVALEYFLKAHAFNPDNAELNMKIGEAYLYTVHKDRSIAFLERAIELNVGTLEVYFLLGNAYHINYRFEEAIDMFNFYRQSLTPQQTIERRPLIEKKIAECNNALKMVENPTRVFIDNLGLAVNSEFDDYSPIISPDGNTVFFTSRRPLGNRPRVDSEDNKYFENIFYARREADRWLRAEPLEGRPNTNSHDATAGISPNGQTLYIYRGDKGGNIFESEYGNGQWGNPGRVRGISERSSQETSIVFTSDERRAYFISDREGGFGGKDIWTTTKDNRGRWTEPVNIGPTVNTEYDEESLYLAPDDMTLYFSSEGHNSMGGYDIFRTQFRNGRWTKPENLGYPINTPGDDLFFIMSPDGKLGYYAAMKPDGYGGSDIYAITFLGPEKPMIANARNHWIASEARPMNDFLMAGEVEVTSVPMTIIRGKITDDATEEPVFATIELYDNEDESLLAQFSSNNETGEYLISLPGGKNYAIAVKADDYLFHSENMNIADSDVAREIINNIRLKRVEIGVSIVLNNIFFDTGAASLRPESYAELGILFQLMQDNPNLKIEISGHTDNVGSAALNKRLSENRARSVVDFLIGRGIDRDRLTYKGYGFDKPIASNDTPEGRQMNRRTEFEIVGK